jgi:class 3 adenylate cyclase
MEQTDKKTAMSGSPTQEEGYAHNKVELGGNKTIMCSVLFLDIVAYSRKSVSEQMELKNSLNSALAEAISMVPTDDRIILDTGDGAAISFLGDVEDALKVALVLAQSLQRERAEQGAPIPVRMGINLGPVRLIKDINGQPNIVGDGINVAQRVMEFSEAGQILISRSYHDAISNLSQEYAAMLHYHGKFTDKHVREHEVYSVRYKEGEQPAPVRNAAHGRDAGGVHDLFSRVSNIFEKAASQPRILIGGIIVGAILLATARMVRIGPQTVAVPAQNTEIAAPQQPTAGVAAQDGQSAREMPAPEVNALQPQDRANRNPAPQASSPEHPAAKPAVTSESPDMGRVSIAVTPWGEVYLDGNIQGISPPLNELEVTPGTHNIEIRNKTSKKYSRTILVKPGQKIFIKYKFTNPLK